uniref:UDP-glucuronosyltransferase n=1 Tax=Eptatretus burgeri TaxID=7764 RepID=A0A8C4Q9D8_EPTBU
MRTHHVPALLAARLALPYVAIFPTSPAARPWKRHQQPYYESKSLWSMFQWKRLRRIWGWLSGEKYDEDPGKQLDETEVEREVWRRFAWVVQKHFVNDEEETNGKKDNHRVPVETDLIWTNSEEMGSVKTSGCDNNYPDVSQQWKKGEMSVVDGIEMRKWMKKQESVSKDSGKNKWFQKRLKGWMECKEEMWNEAQVIIGGEEEYNVSDGKQNEIAFCPIFPPFRNDKMGQSSRRTCCEDNRGSGKRAKEADVREKLMSGRKMQCDEMVERGQCESLSAGLSLPHEWVAEGRRSRTLPRPFTRPRTLAQLEERALVWLYNASPVLEGDSLLLFNEVLLGAMLAKPAKPPPKPLARWLDNAGPEGCVLVALGSMLPSIPRPALTTALAKALGQLGRPVAWRYYAAEWPTGLAIPDNVRLMDWIPLNDALGHPNVRLLVSHGGMNSLLEALYHGVPVLALPLFGDQPEKHRSC